MLDKTIKKAFVKGAYKVLKEFERKHKRQMTALLYDYADVQSVYGGHGMANKWIMKFEHKKRFKMPDTYDIFSDLDKYTFALIFDDWKLVPNDREERYDIELLLVNVIYETGNPMIIQEGAGRATYITDPSWYVSLDFINTNPDEGDFYNYLKPMFTSVSEIEKKVKKNLSKRA